jgi:hypothetical protein
VWSQKNNLVEGNNFPAQQNDKNKKPILVILIVGILISISLFLIGFFFGVKYQTLKFSSQEFHNSQISNKTITPTAVPDLAQPTLKPIPTIQDTPDIKWKNYTHRGIGISFSYPDQLLIDEEPNLARVWLDREKTEINKIPGYETVHYNPYVYFSVYSVSNTSSKSFIDWLRKDEGAVSVPQITLEKTLKLKEINIPGKQVYFYNGMGIGEGRFNYVFIKSQNEYIIFCTMESSRTIENDEILKKILFSVEFI